MPAGTTSGLARNSHRDFVSCHAERKWDCPQGNPRQSKDPYQHPRSVAGRAPHPDDAEINPNLICFSRTLGWILTSRQHNLARASLHLTIVLVQA
jgi:hypothetical protein